MERRGIRGSISQIPLRFIWATLASERIKTIEKLIKEHPCELCRPLLLDWKKIQRGGVY